MKIIQAIPSLHLAGAEIMCENLSVQLKKNGHEVIVISFYGNKTPITQRLEAEGIDVRYLNKKPGVDFSIIGAIRKIVKAERPDVIHTHLNALIYVMQAIRGLNIKRIVHTIHNVAQKDAAGFVRCVQKRYFKKKRVVPVSLSPVIRDTVVEVYGLKKEETPVIFNGVDLSKCIQKQNYDTDKNFIIQHVGRFCEVKNHQMMIEAFKIFHGKYPKAKLRLIGGGELEEKIQKHVEELSLQSAVEFLGYKDCVYPFLNQADIFTLPSHYEGIPLTVAEAMGTGLPVVATAVGGIPDMIEDGVSGLLCDVSIAQIVSCWERYYLDAQLREKHGKAAAEKAKEFSSETMAEKYLKVYCLNETERK